MKPERVKHAISRELVDEILRRKHARHVVPAEAVLIDDFRNKRLGGFEEVWLADRVQLEVHASRW